MFSFGNNIKNTKAANQTVDLDFIASQCKTVKDDLGSHLWFDYEDALTNVFKGVLKIEDVKKTGSEWKKLLPFFIVGGTCEYGHNKTDLIGNGCVQVDIDIKQAGGNALARKIKAELIKLDYIMFAAISPSGYGVKAIVRTDIQDKALYNLIQDYIIQKLNDEPTISPFIIEATQNNKSKIWDKLPASQPCYVPYDQTPYTNHNAMLTIPASALIAPTPKQYIPKPNTSPQTPSITGTGVAGTTTFPNEAMAAAEKKTDRKKGQWQSGNLYDWTLSFAGVCNVFGVPMWDVIVYLQNNKLPHSDKVAERVESVYDECASKFGVNTFIKSDPHTNVILNNSVLDQIAKIASTKFEDDILCFKAIQKFGSLEGETGSGKTYRAAVQALVRLLNGQRTFFIAQDISAMDQFYSDYFIDLVLAELDLTGEQMRYILQRVKRVSANGDEATQDDLIIITHHTYMSRVRFQNRLYSVTQLIDKDTLVIIDEAPMYIHRQSVELEGGALYLSQNKNLKEFSRSPQCPNTIHGQSSRCGSCHHTQGSQVVFDRSVTAIQHDHKLVGEIERDLTPTQILENRPHINLDKLVGVKSKIISLERGLEIGFLKQPNQPDLVEFDAPKEHNEFTIKSVVDALHDIIKWSFNPHYQMEFAVGRSDFKNPQSNPKAIFEKELKEICETLSQEDLKSIIFPFNACSIRRYFFTDTKALRYIVQEAGKVVMMTATFNELHLPILKSVYKHFARHQIPSNINKLDKVDVYAVGTPEDTGINLRKLLPHVARSPEFSSRKVLAVADYQKTAKALFDSFKVERIDNWVYANAQDASITSQRDIALDGKAQEFDGFITYSNSVHAVGADLKVYQDCIVECHFTKPFNLYLTDCSDFNKVVENIEMVKAHTAKQSAGRILRGIGQKRIFLFKPSPETIKSVMQAVMDRASVHSFQRLSLEQFNVKFAKPTPLNSEELHIKKVAASKKKKVDDKLIQLKTRIDDMIKNGIKKRDITNSLNLKRHNGAAEYLNSLLQGH